jgi:hypothetical protein
MLRRGLTHRHPELVMHEINWCVECEQHAAWKWLCPICLDRAKRDRQFAGKVNQHVDDHLAALASE